MFAKSKIFRWQTRHYSTNQNEKSYFKIIEEKLSYGSRLKTAMGIFTCLGATSVVGWFLFRDKFRSVAVKEATVITHKSLQDKDLQEKVNAIAAASTKMVLEDPLVYSKLITLLKVVANDEEITNSTSVLLQQAISQPQFKVLLVKSLSELLEDEEIQQKINNTGRRIVVDLLEDKDLKEKLVSYLQSVAEDPRLQQTVAEGMWASTKKAFFPRILTK